MSHGKASLFEVERVSVITKIGILYHPLIEATHTKSQEIGRFLESMGASVWLCPAWEVEKARAQLSGTDLIITIGGDGTILRAAQIVTPGTFPIVGINFGKLGFMTELTAEEVTGKLPSLLAGKGWVDERAMLEAEITTATQERQVFHALNGVVVARGAIARVVYIAASIDGQPVTTYKADGVVLATATGSTGYALAAGGPILYPQSRDFLLVPIMPHLSLTYTLVLPSTAVVTLHITAVHPATLSIDGHTNLTLSSGDTVTVKHSPNTVRFLRIRSDFYSSLEQRLKGKHHEPDRKG